METLIDFCTLHQLLAGRYMLLGIFNFQILFVLYTKILTKAT